MALLTGPWPTANMGIMWVRGAAIRPVPRYAVVDAATLEQIERELADDSPSARGELDGAFARFETTQPHLADAISLVLSKPLDDTALALGYFLGDKWEQIAELIHHYLLYASIALLAGAGVWYYLRQRRKRNGN